VREGRQVQQRVDDVRGSPIAEVQRPAPWRGSTAGADASRATATPTSTGLLTSFVGRQAEMAELEGRLDRARLLTLVGAPGIGKTRLALETSARHPVGAVFVDLAPVTDPSLTAATVGTALEVPDALPRPTADTLVDWLAERDLLLVLDNCEHVAEAVAGLVAHLLSACPTLRVLATSRTALGLSGEEVWRVPPLDVEPAAQLFSDRARLGSPVAPVDPRDPVVVQVCARLDGMPLAIELAAALSRVLSPEEILGRLDRALPLLRSRLRDVTPRQQTLEATLDWSYGLLDGDTRRQYERLSVFAGGFDLEAAQAVMPDADVLGGLTTLVDHSLVLVGESVAGGARYRLLEPLRQYAAARFDDHADREEREATRRRHAEHHLAVASRLDEDLRTERIRAALRRFGEDVGNFRAALDFARSQPDDLGLRLCTALSRSWALRRRVNEGRAWFEEMLGIETPDRRLQASALFRASRLTWLQHDHAATRQLIEASLAIERELDDQPRVARRLRNLAMVHLAQRRYDEALGLLDECVSLCRAHHDDDGLALGLSFVALGLQLAGRSDEADPYLQEALALSRASNNVVAALYSLSAAVFRAITANDTSRLRQHATQAAPLLRQSDGLDDDLTWLWAGIALASAEGRYRSAIRLAGAEQAVVRRHGIQLAEPFRQQMLPWLERARAAVTPVEQDLLSAEGAAMALDELIDEALASSDVDTASPLSPRELEVAMLVADDLSNVDIAARLVISKRTVESHVAHIKTKVGLARRADLAAWVREGRHRRRQLPGHR
jgi:predicted ATPase/DNA-binding CsgD family transcriptional regulator